MRKPPLGATLGFGAMFAILFGLGSWQVQRLHWKTQLLAHLDAAFADTNPPVLHLNARQLGTLPSSAHDFTAATLRGHFIDSGEIQIGPRTWQDKTGEDAPGYQVIAAFELQDGGVILVDRGWVPMDKKDPNKRVMSAPSLKPITIRGILHAPDRANPFVPHNDVADNLWYRWDLPAMSEALKADGVAPLVLYETAEDNTLGQLPIREALHWTLPNNHLAYAIFWFTMAGILAVMFGFRFLRREPKT